MAACELAAISARPVRDFVSDVRNNIRLLNEQAFWVAPLPVANMLLCLIDSSKNAVKNIGDRARQTFGL